MRWFGHLSRHETLANTILQGRVEGTRIIGRPKRSWIYPCIYPSYIYDVYEWTGMSTLSLLDVTIDRYRWKKLYITSYHVTPTTTRHA